MLNSKPSQRAPENLEPIPTNLVGNVLIVDDNVHNQRLLSRLIGKTGLKTTIACDGYQALRRSEAVAFDLILMDLRMPQLDGYATSRQLRANNFSKPIIAISANHDRSDLQRAIEAGCNGFITKPFPIDAIFQMLREHFEPQINSAVDLPLPQSHSITKMEIDRSPEFENLIHRFVASLPAQIEILEQAVLQKDWQKVHEITHSLKGTAASFGYPRIT